MLRSFALSVLTIMAVAGCRQAPSPKPAPQFDPIDIAPALTPEHVGKRVRFQLRTGGALMTGKVLDVQKERDTAMMELYHGDEIGKLVIRPSQVLWLEELTAVPPSEDAQPEEPPQPEEDRSEIRFGGAREANHNVKVVYVTFRHNHTHEACLLDMAQPMREHPGSVVFVDEGTKATLSVPIPDDPNASLVSWQWHAHIVGGEAAKPTDRLALMNSDGQIQIDFKGVALPATLLLVGTPMRVRHAETNLDAMAPPRVVSLRLLRADSAESVLRNNREILTHVDTGFGDLWVASQPANEGEMLLSLYDPSMKHATVLPQAKFAVQDSILVPSFTLDIANTDGDLWQRIGGYPIPPFLSRDTEETSKIGIEVGGKKLGAAIPAPMQVAVRAPERAAMKADVDVRVYGADPKMKHTLIVAHGRPPEAGKPISFRPTVKELDPAAPMVSMGIDLSGLPREAFPAQVFVWHHVALEWKPAGGFLPPDQPLASGEKSKPARRMMLVHPASHPHLRFIRFEGGAPDLDGGRGILGLAGFVPLGGITLGRGGPLAPFSNEVSTSVFSRDDKDERWYKPHIYSPSATSDAKAFATATAINFCMCGGGSKNPCDDKKDPGGKKDVGKTPAGKRKPPEYPPVETDAGRHGTRPDDWPGNRHEYPPDYGREPIYTPDVQQGY